MLFVILICSLFCTTETLILSKEYRGKIIGAAPLRSSGIASSPGLTSLLTNKKSPEEKSRDALAEALAAGRADVLEKLLKENPDLVMPNVKSVSQRFFRNQKTSLARRLLDSALSYMRGHMGFKAGLKPSTMPEGSTPLQIAIVQGSTDSVRVLLKAGADVSEVSERGDLPIHYAAATGDVAILRELVQAGADPLARGHLGATVAHFAALTGWEALKWALDAGCDIAAVDEHNATVLHYAAYAGRDSAVTHLVKIGGDLLARDALGATPLMWAANGADLATLLTLGADATMRDDLGNTALHFAAGGNELGVHQLLGVSTDLVLNEKGQSAIDVASLRGQAGIVKILCKVATRTSNMINRKSILCGHKDEL